MNDYALIQFSGEFVASADATLIFAAGPTLVSEFKSLDKVN